MFGNNKKKDLNRGNDAHIVTTVIGEDTDFKGSLTTQGSVRIEGNFEGQLHAQGEVYVGTNSKVKAEIFGKKVVVAGEVTGAIEAIAGLEITSTGKVYGDITGDRLTVDEGAIYKGRVNMDVITAKGPDESFEYRPKNKRDILPLSKVTVSEELTEQTAAAAFSFRN